MGKPKPPTPPDPVAVAGAQTQSNAETARLQSNLNNVNYFGPQGSSVYEQTSPDRWSQYVKLSPQEQQTYDLSKSAENSALGTANTQIGRVNQALNQPFGVGDIWSTPAYQTTQHSFDPGQHVQGQIGPQNFDQSVKSTQNAVYNQARSRLDPQFAQQDEQLRTRLANQGLSQNSAAYGNAMDEFNRNKTDAYNQASYSAINAGNQEQQQLFGQQAAQGQFANQAAAQQYGQNQGQAAFYNQGIGQDYQSKMNEYQFQNAAEAQKFQQQAYAQNLPINQFNSLMSSGQVGMPAGVPYSPTSVQPTDVLGAYGMNQAQQNANYQSRMGAYNGALGGLFNLGSSALMMSDRRLKTDVAKLCDGGGLSWYVFRYIGERALQIGVMAQEVMKSKPWAVAKVGPWLAVDYGQL
jgi:hypothetical protein